MSTISQQPAPSTLNQEGFATKAWNSTQDFASSAWTQTKSCANSAVKFAKEHPLEVAGGAVALAATGALTTATALGYITAETFAPITNNVVNYFSSETPQETAQPTLWETVSEKGSAAVNWLSEKASTTALLGGQSDSLQNNVRTGSKVAGWLGTFNTFANSISWTTNQPQIAADATAGLPGIGHVTSTSHLNPVLVGKKFVNLALAVAGHWFANS